jgi:hypothetical protein
MQIDSSVISGPKIETWGTRQLISLERCVGLETRITAGQETGGTGCPFKSRCKSNRRSFDSFAAANSLRRTMLRFCVGKQSDS